MLKRTLWYQDKNNQISVNQDELTKKTNPLVIVGEAGMGKSCLLDWLGEFENYFYCTARQLLSQFDPKTLLSDNRVLVIDGLDEVSSRKDGDSVERILQKLGELGYPQFILACRVADWRSATGLEAIREQYPEEPLELHLEPFTQHDMTQFLGEKLGKHRAQEVIEHFTTRGLDDLLGNPQTLNLIAKVAKTSSLPETLTQLFEEAIELLRIEHSDSKAEAQLPSEIALDAAGAAFASLILTGNEAITRKAIANVTEGELPISEIKLLPDTTNIEFILGTRLFRSNGIERFSYLHRRIGEFLGAKWLAKQANTNRKRKRLLSLFHSYEFVPANLRGLHAWLVNDPALALKVIVADPIGILEYGDIDSLTIEQAKVLFSSIRHLSEKNPRFYNFNNKDTYIIRAFTTPNLLTQIKDIITQPEISFGFRVFLIDAIKTFQLPPDFIQILKNLVKDQNTEFAIRKSAGESLAVQKQLTNWHNIYTDLENLNDDSSIRLAIELLEDTGYDKASNELITNLAISHLKMSNNLVGPLWYLQENLPKEQIKNVLNFFIPRCKTLDRNSDSEVKGEAKNFAHHLILRYLQSYEISTAELWGWLEPFYLVSTYHDESIKNLATFFKNNQNLRQAIQHLVVLNIPSEKNIFQKDFLLRDCSHGLSISSEDIINLLKQLYLINPKDSRWKELVQLTPHDGKIGKEVREAALPFTTNNHVSKQWLNQISIRNLADWEIENIELKKQREEKAATFRAKQRSFYIQNIELLRKGEYGIALNPSKAYLKMFSDIGKDLPAHQRISDWLGEDISKAAMEGFEAFLLRNPPDVTAQDIATILLQGKYYQSGYILTAALAERFRNNITFDDLPNERLQAGYFTLLHSRYDEFAGISGLFKRIKQELKERGIWVEGIKTFYEPKFQARSTYMEGLAQLMRSEENKQLSIELAKEWMQRFTNIPIEPESELLDCLIHAGQFDALQQLISTRTALTDEEQQRNWLVVELIVDFEESSKQLETDSIESNLIWNIRDRINERYRKSKSHLSLNINLLEWIIKTFRMLWVNVGHPTGVSGGDRNSWDASDFIISLIRQLAKNSSDQACEAIERLKSSNADGYTDFIKTMQFEQKQIRTESLYIPPTVQAIKAITNNSTPQSISDLQVVILDELNIVQAKTKSDDAESWRGFFDDSGKPYDEERCRDHLLGLLRQGDSLITFEPEAHVANDKEVDITCSVGTLRLPIEIKGQWHPALWTGADQQLNRLYAQDWRAEGRGIYLVLWFGKRTDNKKLKTLGRGKPMPDTPQELREMLITNSRAAQEGKINIVVLDMNCINP